MTELSALFADVAPDIQQAIRDLGWHAPTPVQSAAIPRMRAGGDLIVQAQTGSGKTGAFGIPLVEAIDTELAETQAIVLLPTRELANQVAVELAQVSPHAQRAQSVPEVLPERAGDLQLRDPQGRLGAALEVDAQGAAGSEREA